MSDLTYTLVTDGSSDRVLSRPIEWLLEELSGSTPLGHWAEPPLRRSSRLDLRARVRDAVEHHPCHLLFVHRDAETRPREERVREIRQALEGLVAPPAVCVVPVRMTEAWLLIDAPQLRRAAGNPRGKEILRLPIPRQLEALPDPKAELHRLLRQAHGARGRRAATFSPHRAVHRLAEFIEDYSPLRQLSAFQAFEADLRRTLHSNGWLRGEP